MPVHIREERLGVKGLWNATTQLGFILRWICFGVAVARRPQIRNDQSKQSKTTLKIKTKTMFAHL